MLLKLLLTSRAYTSKIIVFDSSFLQLKFRACRTLNGICPTYCTFNLLYIYETRHKVWPSLRTSEQLIICIGCHTHVIICMLITWIWCWQPLIVVDASCRSNHHIKTASIPFYKCQLANCWLYFIFSAKCGLSFLMQAFSSLCTHVLLRATGSRFAC